jgi:hypothetical protein
MREITGPLENILAAVDRIGSAEVEAAEGSTLVRVGDREVARIDLIHDELLVEAPPDVLPALQREFPSARCAPAGLVFDVADSQGQPDALEALHRRVKVEQLAWQARVGSP